MNILTHWLRSYLPTLPVPVSGDPDRQLAEDLTLRGIAVEGEFPAAFPDGRSGGALYEMDITTNRVDAMNHYGVAREAAAIYNVALAPIPETAPLEAAQDGPPFPVRIDAPDLCGRFTARVIRNVTVGPSTGILADYFAALGQKPISAPVDATNFGWLAIGQPTHVFDLDKIHGTITARRAVAGEKLRLLDGTERTLVADDLVIADDIQALSLAGVMGGWDSRVTESTTNILVEAAWFDPASIRASSRRHGLHTDASHRYERGADFNAAPLASNLVTRLILSQSNAQSNAQSDAQSNAQSGGEVVGPLTDIVVPAMAARTANRPAIALQISEVTRHLGTTLEDQQGLEGAGLQPRRNVLAEDGALAPEGSSSLNAAVITQYLTALGCELTQTLPGTYAVKLPSWRLDLTREIDLIEEIARVYGYNRFANTLPSFTGSVVELPHAEQEKVLRSTLRGLGFSETISSTFCSAEEAATFAEAALSVPLGNPLSAEAGMLRPSLAPGMATALALNLHRDVATVRLFELGTVFTGTTAEVHEHTSLAIGLTGTPKPSALYRAEDALYYEAKSALETLLARFTGTVTFDTTGLPSWLAPGRGARVLLTRNGGQPKPVAFFGELSATELQSRKLRQPCVVATVDAHMLLATPLRQPAIRELSRYQAVARDFSFLFPDTVQWHTIAAALASLNIPELQRSTPLEVFRDPKGKAVATGSYSLLTRVLFQSPDRTLTEEELTRWNNDILKTLQTLGGTQRI